TVRAALAVSQSLALAGFVGDLTVRFASDMTVTLAEPDYSLPDGNTVLTFDSMANANGGSLTIDGAGHVVELVGSCSGILSLASARSLVVSGVVFRGGSAGSGGAMTLNAPAALLDSVTVVENRSSSGGGVYSYAPLTVVNSTFSHNSVGFNA